MNEAGLVWQWNSSRLIHRVYVVLAGRRPAGAVFQYVGGEVYEYFKVTKNDYTDLLRAKSIGWSVNKRIKPYYITENRPPS